MKTIGSMPGRRAGRQTGPALKGILLAAWKGGMVSVTRPSARMFAARNADHAHPLRTEGEGADVFDYLRRLEGERAAAK